MASPFWEDQLSQFTHEQLVIIKGMINDASGRDRADWQATSRPGPSEVPTSATQQQPLPGAEHRHW